MSEPVFEIGERVRILEGVFPECENAVGTIVDWKSESDSEHGVYDQQQYWIYKVVFDVPVVDEYNDTLDHLWFVETEMETLVRKPVVPSGFARFVLRSNDNAVGRSQDADPVDLF